MSPRNELENDIRILLEGMGLHVEAVNHILPRADDSEETEIDIVLTCGGATFLVEVTENAQKDTRRRKRKDLRTWDARDLAGRISKDLGLLRSNHVRIVYISMAEASDMRPAMDEGILLLKREHIVELDNLESDGLEMFIKWCGLEGKVDPGG